MSGSSTREENEAAVTVYIILPTTNYRAASLTFPLIPAADLPWSLTPMGTDRKTGMAISVRAENNCSRLDQKNLSPKDAVVY